MAKLLCPVCKKNQKQPYKWVTCQDVLGHDFDLHLQWMLGGVSDLSGDVGNLANEHGGQELCLLHPNQSHQTAILERRSTPKNPPNIQNIQEKVSFEDAFKRTMTSLINDN